MSEYIIIKRSLQTLFRSLGPLFSIIGVAAMILEIYVHFAITLPYYFGSLSQWGFLALLNFVLSCWIVFCLFYNFFYCAFTNPGNPPYVQLTESEILEYRNNPVYRDGFSIFCNICNQPKPERTHHCKICNVCVLKMDHHCIWVSNCIGHRNHHYFFLFLLYLLFGNLYTLLMLMSPIRYSLSDEGLENFKYHGLIRISFIFGLFAIVGVYFIFSHQLHLIITGQTSIEKHYNDIQKNIAQQDGIEYKYPYDFGITNNFRNFFGIKHTDWKFAWLIPSKSHPTGDGIHFPRNRD